MSKGLVVGLAGLFTAGVLGLAVISSHDPKSCSLSADGDILLNYKDGKTTKAGPAVQLTDDDTKCFNHNGGGTPPDWVVPLVPVRSGP